MVKQNPGVFAIAGSAALGGAAFYAHHVTKSLSQEQEAIVDDEEMLGGDERLDPISDDFVEHLKPNEETVVGGTVEDVEVDRGQTPRVSRRTSFDDDVTHHARPEDPESSVRRAKTFETVQKPSEWELTDDLAATNDDPDLYACYFVPAL